MRIQENDKRDNNASNSCTSMGICDVHFSEEQEMKDKITSEPDFKFTEATIKELTDNRGEENGIHEQSSCELYSDKSKQE